MILAALYELYGRRMRDPDPARRLPALGLEEKGIPFILDIDTQGRLINLTDTRSGGKKPMPQKFLVPQGVKKTSGVAANLLWDNAEYVLGADTRGKPERVAEQHAAFRARIQALPETARKDAGIVAINKFLDQINLDQLAAYPSWQDILEANLLLTFRLHGDIDLICQRPGLIDAVEPEDEKTTTQSICLVTGESAPIERLHASIKGVWGAQTAGANIVSFNADAYCSFGNNDQQGANAPVSKRAAFAYTTTLNALLAKDSGQRVQVGDASTVFWAEVDHELETVVVDAFGESPKDDPSRGADAVKRLFAWVYSGKPSALEGSTRFYVLGLAPNAARIAVRFWHVLPLRDLAMRIVQHYADLKITRGNLDPEYPSLFRLLASCATQGKADNIPPNLGGEVMRAILTGSAYPAIWLSAAIRRCRAEQHVNHLRAAIIKACINRAIRHANLSNTTPEKEFAEMLDPDNQSNAYRLGRLFATLEKIQEEASPGLNATIRDRFYGAASSTPVTVFTSLLRLHHHHLAKLNPGRRVNMEKLIGEIMMHIEHFPSHLALPEQGRFAIGYYHQRQAFFAKSNNAEQGAI
jgi:CRISPR-associated protein Csd1